MNIYLYFDINFLVRFISQSGFIFLISTFFQEIILSGGHFSADIIFSVFVGSVKLKSGGNIKVKLFKGICRGLS